MESENIDAKRNLIQSIGENLFLRDKKLEFSFKKPYDVLLLPQARSDVQGLVEKLRTLSLDFATFNNSLMYA